MIRQKNASIECRENIVGRSAANSEEIAAMARAAARDRGVLMFDLKAIKSESDRIYLRSLFKRQYGVTEIGGPK